MKIEIFIDRAYVSKFNPICGWVLSTFEKKYIFLFEKSKTHRNISKNWCWTCKISGTLLKMLVILFKMMNPPCKMSAAPRIMSAATHLMFAKIQRGGLMCPPTPILEKTFVSRNDF